MANVIVAGIVIILIGAAGSCLYRAKKRGAGCIGCSSGGSCPGSLSCSTGGCCPGRQNCSSGGYPQR